MYECTPACSLISLNEVKKKFDQPIVYCSRVKMLTLSQENMETCCVCSIHQVMIVCFYCYSHNCNNSNSNVKLRLASYSKFAENLFTLRQQSINQISLIQYFWLLQAFNQPTHCLLSQDKKTRQVFCVSVYSTHSRSITVHTIVTEGWMSRSAKSYQC